MKKYTVCDEKAENWDTDWTAPTDGAALRAFADEINKAGTRWNIHPEDYSLWLTGEFNPTTGQTTGLESPKFIAKAMNLVIKEN